MNDKTCARCLKTVYPVEELRCLDKVWHKSCFRCTVCGMALNLKNYKGYDRMPYCSAHIPKVQPTPIASTCEMKRLTNTTRIQSNVKYRQEYERDKGRYKPLADDDPEIEHLRNNKSKPYSNVAYRVGKLEHKNIVEQRKRELDHLFRKRTMNPTAISSSSSSTTQRSVIDLYVAKTRNHELLAPTLSTTCSDSTGASGSNVRIRKYSLSSNTSNKDSSSSSKQSSNYSSDSDDIIEQPRLMAGNAPETLSHMEEIFTRPTFNVNDSGTSIFTVQSTREGTKSTSERKLENRVRVVRSKTASNVTLTASNSKKLDNRVFKKESLEAVTRYVNQLATQTSTSAIRQDETLKSSPPIKVMERKSSNTALCIYRAIFDFKAQDHDEVSFIEGDYIYEVEPENSGWLTGRVERTGKVGMLPGNYVERLEGEKLEAKRREDEVAAMKEAILTAIE